MSYKRIDKTKSVKKSGSKKSTQAISKQPTDWKSMLSRLWELFREEEKIKHTGTYMSKRFQKEDLKKVHDEMKPLQKKLFKLYLPKPMTEKLSWTMQPLYNATTKETYMFFMDESRVVGYLPKIFEGSFAIEDAYPISLEKVEKYISDAEFLGMEHVPLDGSPISLDYLKPLLKASKKIGLKEIRIAGTSMPIEIEHKEGTIAIAPRVVYEGIDHSDKLPNAVRQFEVKLDSSVEMIVYANKELTTKELIDELRGKMEYEHFSKREMLKIIDKTVEKSTNLKFHPYEKMGHIPKNKSYIYDSSQVQSREDKELKKEEPSAKEVKEAIDSYDWSAEFD